MTTPINPSFWQGRLRALFFVKEMGPAGGGGKAGILEKGKINKWRQVNFLPTKKAQETGFRFVLNAIDSRPQRLSAARRSAATERSKQLFLNKSCILPHEISRSCRTQLRML